MIAMTRTPGEQLTGSKANVNVGKGLRASLLLLPPWHGTPTPSRPAFLRRAKAKETLLAPFLTLLPPPYLNLPTAASPVAGGVRRRVRFWLH